MRNFKDRHDAGQQLAQHLTNYAERDDVLVLGLPRGGVPVAYEVAAALHAPLDIFSVRKLGVPTHDEMAMGAIATGDTRVLNEQVVERLDIHNDTIQNVEERERRELQRRESLYRGDQAPPQIAGKTAILVDDGLATGATMRAAVQALKQHDPAAIIIAVPTAARRSCDEFRQVPEVDDVVCVLTPDNFRAVGLWYENFGQTSDDDVQRLLRDARERDSIPTPETI